MADTITAQMAQRKGENGRSYWRLYVCLMGETHWPEHVFRGAKVPTMAQRSKALAALGYVVALPQDDEEAFWDWCETRAAHDCPDSPVTLIASVQVRPVGEAAQPQETARDRREHAMDALREEYEQGHVTSPAVQAILRERSSL
ncbi:DUF6303 family protein [Streptomyces sp. NPDC005970]|uniref:DUF6303 family protein n=1 Tax=Streptomyces sp. NPDC005970 TaxID=3156723 RepID=UPI00340AC04E